MRRSLAILVAVVATLTIVGSVLAANPHYVGPKTPTYSINPDTGALTVNFKAAGYGSGEQVDYTATFDYMITMGCVTPSGSNEPSGLQSTSGSSSSSGTLTASRTGTLSGPVTLFPGTDFECPSHRMQEVVVFAEFTNIVFTLEGIGPYGPSSVTYTR